ncbi:MAG: CD225/dispanin family protein [Salinimicrobium sp.]
MNQYFYSDGLQKHGPFSLEELKNRNISRNTMVWTHPMEKWLPAEQLPELQDIFANQPPDLGRPARSVSTPAYGHQPPKSWLVESILVTLFCCIPFGIAGIVNAAKVETRFNAGDYEGARRSSEEAGKWTKIGFWLTLAGVVVYLLFLAFVVAVDQL